MIGDALAAQAVDQVVVAHQHAARPAPDLGLMLPDPEQLGQHVERRGPFACSPKERLGRVSGKDFSAFIGRAAIQPVDGVAEWLALGVQQDERDALRADRQPAHRPSIGVCGVERQADGARVSAHQACGSCSIITSDRVIRPYSR